MNGHATVSPHLFVGHVRAAMDGEPVRHVTYQLVVRGELDEGYGYLFEGMQMERAGGTTVVSGPVRDQAHLYGLIERVKELGLELLSVRQVATTPAGSEEQRNEA